MASTVNEDAVPTFLALLASYLRMPTGYINDPTVGGSGFVFSPPLDPTTEQPIFDRLVKIANSAVRGLSPAEFSAIENDIATCRAYVGVTSPTAAQSAAALKALIRIVAALVRQ